VTWFTLGKKFIEGQRQDVFENLPRHRDLGHLGPAGAVLEERCPSYGGTNGSNPPRSSAESGGRNTLGFAIMPLRAVACGRLPRRSRSRRGFYQGKKRPCHRVRKPEYTENVPLIHERLRLRLNYRVVFGPPCNMVIAQFERLERHHQQSGMN
jgi:hypothetical protein